MKVLDLDIGETLTVFIIIIYFRGDIREVEFRLDKEGKEFHHFEEFAKMYRAEVG